MKLDKNVKIYFVTVLIVLIAWQSTLTNCVKEAKSYFDKEDVYQPSLFNKRFEKLRSLLGPYESIGFIDAKKNIDLPFIQYALAPVLVVRDAEPEYIIAYIGKVDCDIDFIDPNKYLTVEKLEGGFLLLKRKDSKER